jgi:hypothetical protein
MGIEALGETESEEALDFLRSLLKMECSEETDYDSGGIVIGSDPYYYIQETFSFPNAPGPLGEHLQYCHSDNEMNCVPFTEEEHREARSRIDGHRAIADAIAKLSRSGANLAAPDTLIETVLDAGLGCESCHWLLGALSHSHASELLAVSAGLRSNSNGAKLAAGGNALVGVVGCVAVDGLAVVKLIWSTMTRIVPGSEYLCPLIDVGLGSIKEISYLFTGS